MPWECGIDGCGAAFDAVEPAIVHQARQHERHQCRVCGTIVPDGFLAIRHAFSEHSRAEYVRAYGASAEAVRTREEILDLVEHRADLERVAGELGVDTY